jgi:hypothetical protein
MPDSNHFHFPGNSAPDNSSDASIHSGGIATAGKNTYLLHKFLTLSAFA